MALIGEIGPMERIMGAGSERERKELEVKMESELLGIPLQPWRPSGRTCSTSDQVPQEFRVSEPEGKLKKCCRLLQNEILFLMTVSGTIGWALLLRSYERAVEDAKGR